MSTDQERHQRRSIRLKGYDYTIPGAYFVTIVTWQRDPLFGEILEGEVRLSRLGEIVREEWLQSAQMRREIELYDDEFVIMPNHLHAIVWIIDNDPIVGADGIRPTGAVPQETHQHGARRADEPGTGRADEPGTGRADELGARRVPLPRRAGRSLGSLVAGFKSSVTSRARRELDVSGVWQRNYYEHIIRNEAELKRIQAYIQNNPNQWEADQLHPAAEPNRFNQG